MTEMGIVSDITFRDVGAQASTPLALGKDKATTSGSTYVVGDVKYYFTGFTVDEETGAIYFRLNPQEGEIAKSIPFDTQVVQDVDAEGKTVGIELLVRDKELLDAIVRTLKYSYQY